MPNMKDHGTTYGIISEGRLPNFAETAAKGDDKKKNVSSSAFFRSLQLRPVNEEEKDAAEYIRRKNRRLTLDSHLSSML